LHPPPEGGIPHDPVHDYRDDADRRLFAPGPGGRPRAPALPVREITIFKDGHSLLLHEGELPVDESGAVLLDGLPQPSWDPSGPTPPSRKPRSPPSSPDTDRPRERDAATVADLLTANKGSLVTLGTNSRETVTGTLIAVNGTLAFVRTAEGLRPLLLNQIDTATFRDRNETHVAEDQDRTALTLRLDWGREPRAKTARVGMMYLQRASAGSRATRSTSTARAWPP